MAGSGEVLAGVRRRPGVAYPVLVPNLTGLELALAAGAAEVAVFGAASETFSQRNINCSIDESFERFAAVAGAARAKGVAVRGYLSCVLGCPYEGEVEPGRVAVLAERLLGLGIYEVSLGDTIGVGTPGRARALVEAVASRVPVGAIAVHFHDTYGQALANILAALQAGVAVVDSAVGGLGGCPYAPGASGNVATEDVTYMLDGLGIATGVDRGALLDATRLAAALTGRPPVSRAAQALLAKTAAAAR
jgi:isopropylmalate/homocitrate/citramalate synthase